MLLLLVGIGGAMFHPQALAGVRSLLGERQGFLTSVFLVGLWVSEDNIASVFWVVSGLGLASALFALLFPSWLMHEHSAASTRSDQA